jgi:uncharacterized protein YjeT (DUF2065 family)
LSVLRTFGLCGDISAVCIVVVVEGVGPVLGPPQFSEVVNALLKESA